MLSHIISLMYGGGGGGNITFEPRYCGASVAQVFTSVHDSVPCPATATLTTLNQKLFTLPAPLALDPWFKALDIGLELIEAIAYHARLQSSSLRLIMLSLE